VHSPRRRVSRCCGSFPRTHPLTRGALRDVSEHKPVGACSAALDNGTFGINDNFVSKRSRPGNPSLAVAYLRASTDEQTLGPEAQKIAIESWAARHGVQIAAWHVDQGVSGGADIGDRPALVAALGELRATGAGLLVVAKRDRLARDVYVAGAIERAVAQSGARVSCADGTANGDTPADAFMRSILDAAAAYERALIRARTKAALGAKKARGERAGTIAYGYRLGADSIRVERDEAEQGVLSAVGELRAAGMSQRAIVAVLAARGLVSRSGGPFNQTQVARMLAKRGA
jgi:DNA invertase Pin-like site-specific DNA recombinase